jgi:hypothetical protein
MCSCQEERDARQAAETMEEVAATMEELLSDLQALITLDYLAGNYRKGQPCQMGLNKPALPSPTIQASPYSWRRAQLLGTWHATNSEPC